jgi:hypothetical protein
MLYGPRHLSHSQMHNTVPEFEMEKMLVYFRLGERGAGNWYWLTQLDSKAMAICGEDDKCQYDEMEGNSNGETDMSENVNS